MAAVLRPLPDSARLAAGVMLTLLLLVAIGHAAHASLLIAPFGATAALKHAAPHSPLASPRNVLGGYLIGALTGLVTALVLGDLAVAAPLAAGLAAAAMARAGCDHPPAVAMTVVAWQTPAPWAVMVAVAGAALMTASTVVLAPLLHRQRYPVRAQS